jgi:hypothetical protein
MRALSLQASAAFSMLRPMPTSRRRRKKSTMPNLDEQKKAERAMKPVAEDPLRAPDGIYSGMAKRSAITDGRFAEVSNMPTGVTRRRTVIPGTSDVED